ncbi:hypothetical protein [Streptosporangium sp. NPDC006007]|uniref:hypothetical protein n=1 Tax=Streptosporangium sp. NPDC006007 TaxID=3154575 RepID=UPI0033ADFEED
MSGTSALPSPPVAPRTLSAYGLPVHALRIFGVRALSLVLWFSAGRAVRAGLMWAGTEVSHGDHRQTRLVLTMLILTLIVLNQLVVTVGMLYTVRGALREIQVRRAGNEAQESLFGALNRATPVFATVYLAWSLHVEDAREFTSLDMVRRADQDLKGILAGVQGEGGAALTTLDVRPAVAIAVAAYLLKVLFGRWRTGGRGRGALVVLFELTFALYGVGALFAFTSARSEWMSQRVVVSTVAGWVERAERVVPWWKTFLTGVGEVWPYVVDALIVPFTWLTVASLVYGAFAEDTRAVVRGAGPGAVAGRMGERPHSLTRSTLSRAAAGLRGRWAPPANALRLATRGGAVLLGAFCLCYVALRVGADYADRGVRTLVGAEEPYLWLVISPPLEFARDLVVTVPTICLLAAAFDIAATRGREAGEALTA